MRLIGENRQLDIDRGQMLRLSGPIDSNSVGQVIFEMFDAAERFPKRPLYLFINSDGGDLYQVFALQDAKALTGVHLVTVAFGIAYSAALFLMQVGDERLATPTAHFLFHAGHMDFTGNYADAIEMVKQREVINERLYAFLSERIGRPAAELRELAGKDQYWTPQEAIAYGAIDAIL